MASINHADMMLIQQQQDEASQAEPRATMASTHAINHMVVRNSIPNYQSVEVDNFMGYPYGGEGAYFTPMSEDKPGSMTATTPSFVNVRSPSAITDGGESYDMLRSYSGGSNQTQRLGTNSPLYSGQNSMADLFEWTHGAELGVDVEGMAADYPLNALAGVQDHKFVLGSMYSSGEYCVVTNNYNI